MEYKRKCFEHSVECKDSALLSFENEVEITNRKIGVLSKKMEQMQRVSVAASETDINIFDTIETQDNVINQSKVQLKLTNEKKTEADISTDEFKNELEKTYSALASSKEKLTVLKVATLDSKIYYNSEVLIQQVQKFGTSLRCLSMLVRSRAKEGKHA